MQGSLKKQFALAPLSFSIKINEESFLKDSESFIYQLRRVFSIVLLLKLLKESHIFLSIEKHNLYRNISMVFSIGCIGEIRCEIPFGLECLDYRMCVAMDTNPKTPEVSRKRKEVEKCCIYINNIIGH